jgi:hypothetical protein
MYAGMLVAWLTLLLPLMTLVDALHARERPGYLKQACILMLYAALMASGAYFARARGPLEGLRYSPLYGVILVVISTIAVLVGATKLSVVALALVLPLQWTT